MARKTPIWQRGADCWRVIVAVNETEGIYRGLWLLREVSIRTNDDSEFSARLNRRMEHYRNCPVEFELVAAEVIRAEPEIAHSTSHADDPLGEGRRSEA